MSSNRPNCVCDPMPAGLSGAESLTQEYMWMDISNLEFGQMRDYLRRLGTEGWEVDGVVDEYGASESRGGGIPAPVSLRLRRHCN